MNVFLMVHHTFFSVKPTCHLWEFILEFSQSIHILGKINMKALSIFCVEIVGSTVELNQFIVMTSIVKLRNVKNESRYQGKPKYHGLGGMCEEHCSFEPAFQMCE